MPLAVRPLLVEVQRDLVLEDQQNGPTKQNGITNQIKGINGYTTAKNLFLPSRNVQNLSLEREGVLSAD